MLPDICINSSSSSSETQFPSLAAVAGKKTPLKQSHVHKRGRGTPSPGDELADQIPRAQPEGYENGRKAGKVPQSPHTETPPVCRVSPQNARFSAVSTKGALWVAEPGPQDEGP